MPGYGKSQACLGVGTNKCKLAETSYVHLYGQDENSWALCFGLDREFAAYHKGQLCVMQDLNGKALAPVKHERGEAREAREALYISFQISSAGQMLVTLPGHEQMVVPFEIPEDLDVFVTASTVYGHGKIRISSVPFEKGTNSQDSADSNSSGTWRCWTFQLLGSFAGCDLAENRKIPAQLRRSRWGSFCWISLGSTHKSSFIGIVLFVTLLQPQSIAIVVSENPIVAY